MSEENHRPSKKNYRTPELHLYGDIRAITQTIMAGTGTVDNTTGMLNHKTHA